MEKRVADWKSTLRYLKVFGEPVLESEQLITIMISIMPEELRTT